MAKPKERKRIGFLQLTRCRSWPEAESRLKEGASCASVAEYMHRQGDLINLKPESLARQLSRYRDANLRRAALSPTFIDKAIEGLSLEINDIDELTRAILIQKQRVAKDLELEARLPKILPGLSKEIMTLFDMIERRARLLQDLGRLYKAPIQSEVKISAGPSWEDMLGELPDDDRVKLRQVVQTAYARQRIVEGSKGELNAG